MGVVKVPLAAQLRECTNMLTPLGR